MISPNIFAFLFSACSYSSNITTPAPSAITKPDLLLSKGSDALLGSGSKLSALRLTKPPMPSSFIGASAPPAKASSK